MNHRSRWLSGTQWSKTEREVEADQREQATSIRNLRLDGCMDDPGLTGKVRCRTINL